GEYTEETFVVKVRPHAGDKLLITEIKTMEGITYPVGEIRKGDTPNFNSADTVLVTLPEEINFSDPGRFAGFMFIKTDVNDANRSEENFLSFMVSDDADIYIAYEKLDNLFRSSI